MYIHEHSKWPSLSWNKELRHIGENTEGKLRDYRMDHLVS